MSTGESLYEELARKREALILYAKPTGTIKIDRLKNCRIECQYVDDAGVPYFKGEKYAQQERTRSTDC